MSIKMKHLLITCIISIFLSINAYSQLLNEFNAPTAEHQLVEGTNISIIPPKDFLPSPEFKGFKNPNDPTSMIMVMEIPGPFSEVSKGFNEEMMLARGMKLTSKEEVEVTPFSGMLIELEQEANGRSFSKAILVYGDSSFTAMVNGVYLADSVDLGKKINQSIVSTVVNQEMEINPREALDFTLQESKGNLKFLAVIGNGMLLNRDLKTPTESEDKATLIVDRSFEKLDIENKEAFCLSRLQQFEDDFQVIEDRGMNEMELDGLNGYELYAQNMENETEEMYQLILFPEDGGYYIIIGTYVKGSQSAMRDIKLVLDTFKRKEG